MPESTQHGRWTTADEIDYLTTIGTHRDPQLPRDQRRPPLDARTLLIRYRGALTHRVVWGQLDPVAIRAFVDQRIADLTPARG